MKGNFKETGKRLLIYSGIACFGWLLKKYVCGGVVSGREEIGAVEGGEEE